jgi:hypothetical protein
MKVDFSKRYFNYCPHCENELSSSSKHYLCEHNDCMSNVNPMGTGSKYSYYIGDNEFVEDLTIKLIYDNTLFMVKYFKIYWEIVEIANYKNNRYNSLIRLDTDWNLDMDNPIESSKKIINKFLNLKEFQ